MNKVNRYIEKLEPVNYNIFLDIHREDKTFDGKVKIKAIAKSNEVSVHQKDLDIKCVTMNGEKLVFKKDDENEALHIFLNSQGDVNLEIIYSGVITDNMTGMYPSYFFEDGVKKELISTQFESHFAREVFPCVDEPEAKATFDLMLTFPNQTAKDIAISNMPEIEVEKRIETGVYKFDTTPRMSTYLLAFAIGEMQHIETTTKNGTKVGVYTSYVHDIKSLDFALDIAKRSIEFYENYFNVKYPIPQSLHVALPDFSAGAMENWGLVTYREVYLIANENTSISSKQQIALVIAHEVAHQWFGNLVTMKWWDDLWLNESFANMMEYVCVDALEPSWNIIEDFQTGGVIHALKKDATDKVQSVHVEVNHPDEINTLFDPAIVYAKGSRLMHMLRRWLGDESFSKGLSKYFEKHSYGNTIGENLWEQLSNVSGKDVSTFMTKWLEQPGYPVVNLKVENDDLVISQKQFFIGEHEDKNRTWHVVLNSNWEDLPTMLTEDEMVVKGYSKLGEKNEEPLRINTENTAHYIVKYDDALFEALLENFNNLSNITKKQIVQDYSLLAEAGLVSYDKLIKLLALFKEETAYITTSAAHSLVSAIKIFLTKGSEEEAKFKKIVEQIFEANFNRLGFSKLEGEKDEDEMVRQIAISNMLYAGNEKAKTMAHEIYEKYEENLEKMPADIRGHILQNEVSNYEVEGLADKFITLYKQTNDSNFRRNISNALSYTKEDKTVSRVLEILKDKDIVKPQDLAMSWYYGFLLNEKSELPIWNWATKNWEWITKALGGDMSFDKFVIYPAMAFKTQEMLDEYVKFFEPQIDNMAISRNIKMGINQIKARVKMIEDNKKIVEKSIMEF